MSEKTTNTASRIEVATLGGGCFWCIEAVFQLIRGVEKVEPGYAGGDLPNPSYEQVSTGRTGHVEVANVTFDPDAVSFREILEIFFGNHDPTQLNRQGADVGTQYRSVIFYRSEKQKTTAQQLIEELTAEEAYGKPIVTAVEPLKAFYPAETYHKDYFKNHPKEPYCQAVIAPKIAKLQKTFLSKLKAP
ncbi:MAG: peptide-methionine (S)-S-oxide reductase MsrA [Candidatus Bathyarchaeota archaeon]|nr:peptide-methionine (S)-S-oxide reductase MsrA [Candidatus Bathyarchaeota archaeon]